MLFYSKMRHLPNSNARCERFCYLPRNARPGKSLLSIDGAFSNSSQPAFIGTSSSSGTISAVFHLCMARSRTLRKRALEEVLCKITFYRQDRQCVPQEISASIQFLQFFFFGRLIGRQALFWYDRGRKLSFLICRGTQTSNEMYYRQLIRPHIRTTTSFFFIIIDDHVRSYHLYT